MNGLLPKLKTLFAILLVFIYLSGCILSEKDDKDDVDIKALYDTWQLYHLANGERKTITFNNDKTFITNLYKIKEDGTYEIYQESGTYTVSNETITLNNPNNIFAEKYNFKISDDELTLDSGSEKIVLTKITLYTLKMGVNNSMGGTTNPSIGSHIYEKGTYVTVTAAQAYGYGFVNWTGNVSNPTEYKTTVIMSDNQTLIANFGIVEWLKVDIKLVSIPAGSYRMGDITGVGYSNERPVHTVGLAGFSMSIYEITQGQYEKLLNSNPSYADAGIYKDAFPVDSVNWFDAIKFCNRLSDVYSLEKCYNEKTWECDFTKNGFRLPTEAEWEYACRAGTETDYYTGNKESDLASAGWYKGNAQRLEGIGQYTPNAFGLYDMHGNVWEWCNDWFESYSSISQIDPIGPSSGTQRVFRGGGWTDSARGCRSACRNFESPSFTDRRVGFRVVRRP